MGSLESKGKEELTVEEIVVCGHWPEVGACFEFKPCTEEAFNAWEEKLELSMYVKASWPNMRI